MCPGSRRPRALPVDERERLAGMSPHLDVDNSAMGYARGTPQEWPFLFRLDGSTKRGGRNFLLPPLFTFYHERPKGLLHDHEFDPSVLRTTLTGFVVGYRFRAAVALHRHPTPRNVVLILNVFLGTFGSLFSNLLVRCF